MKIYIDSDYKCHVSNDGTMREFDVPFFDSKCDTFIEGYRYVPGGEVWTRADGATFGGEMLSPWKPYAELAKAQAEYENEQLKQRVADLETELAATKIILGVE